MRPSAITTDNGTIAVGGEAISTGSCLSAAVGITGMRATDSRHGVMPRTLTIRTTAQSTATTD